MPLEVQKTRDDAEDFGTGHRKFLTREDAVEYLEEDPRHAIVIFGTSAGVKFDPPVYVLRGASEQLDNFFYGEYPAEDPGDASDAESASEALQEALDMALTR